MKNYLRNALRGFIIGLLLIPITFVELYYVSGEIAYFNEVINFKNYISISIIIPSFSLIIGILLTIFIAMVSKAKEKEWNLKSSLIFSIKLLIALLIGILIVYLLSKLFINKISEPVKILMIANSIITIILLLLIFTIEESMQIRKINKRIKENK